MKHYHQIVEHRVTCCPLEGGRESPPLTVSLVEGAEAVGCGDCILKTRVRILFVPDILISQVICIFSGAGIFTPGFGLVFRFVVAAEVAGRRALNMAAISHNCEYTLCIGFPA